MGTRKRIPERSDKGPNKDTAQPGRCAPRHTQNRSLSGVEEHIGVTVFSQSSHFTDGKTEALGGDETWLRPLSL